MMQTVVLGLLAETFLHPGSGGSLGVIDLPVAREAATSYPFVPGSGLKGALRDIWQERSADQVGRLFGQHDAAGALIIGDARIALLPVRSLDGPYAWTTCPQLLERIHRDLQRSGWGLDPISGGAAPEPGEVLVGADALRDDPMILEEQSFRRVAAPGTMPPTPLDRLVAAPARERLRRQLVVLSDEDFAWFARFGLAVHARNVLDDETKASKNLWYEEALPPDTLLYALVSARDVHDVDEVVTALRADPYLQLGGNETVGQGWVRVEVLETMKGEQ